MSAFEISVIVLLSLWTISVIVAIIALVRLHFINNVSDYDVLQDEESDAKNNVVSFNDSVQRQRKFDRDI